MNHKANKTLKKYLDNHSSDVISADSEVFQQQSKLWGYVLVIPVCGEPEFSLDYLMQQQSDISVLIILVINRPLNHEKSAEWEKQNTQLKGRLESDAIHVTSLSEQHQLFINRSKSAVLMLDFNQQPFDPKKGVGLARKLGADTALKLIDMGCVEQPWIYSTDADVVLPKKYFKMVNSLNNDYSAVCLNFKHTGVDPLLSGYQKQYDLKLRYYQSGVRFTGAKYDYIPLGSTLVVNACAYAQVRGFPCRSAGEDFYILNKLAKVSPVFLANQIKVKIKSRFSDRVPFGTGPAIQNIKVLEQKGEAYLYYDPKCFVVIRQWRKQIIQYYKDQELPVDSHGLNKYWNITQILDNGLSQCKTELRWQQFIHEWFDAFRILKSVHYLSESMPQLNQTELLNSPTYQLIFNS